MHAGVFLEQWLETFVRPFRAPSTAACYRRAIVSLPSAVTACDLAALDGLTLQAAINAQARKHPRAAQLTFATLHAALAKAVQLGYIQRNPIDACIRPKHEPKKAAVFTPQQLAAYIEAARAEAAFPLLLLIATLGLRRSEALAVTWDRIDLASGSLRVDRQRVRIDHRMQFCPLKSKASRRTLPLSPPIVAELVSMRSAQRVVSFSGLLFDTNPDSLRKAHLRTIQRAQLPGVTLHGLRHSVATAQAVSGCPMKVLQGMLGHSRFELTANLYADHIGAADCAPYMAALASVVLG